VIGRARWWPGMVAAALLVACGGRPSPELAPAPDELPDAVVPDELPADAPAGPAPEVRLDAERLRAFLRARDSLGTAAVADTPALAALLALSVVDTARAYLGRPYRLGGQGADGDGFDCSGLIQYAYRVHGITLPRVSRDQARVGAPVERRLDQLRPGDILTFGRRRGGVTHVALYTGEGRFLHAARDGVRESPFVESDPYGRYWLRRWLGVRRLLQAEGLLPVARAATP